MRIQMALVAGVLAAASAWAARGTTTFQTMSAEEGARLAQAYGETRPRVAAWIWTDKYTYAPGSSATLRATIKTNGDVYPYVIIAYLQNNQTGKKSYLPGNSDTVTDYQGNTLEAGFRPVGLRDGAKFPLFEGVTLPSDPGMYTFAVELRDYSGGRVLKASYAKIGVVTKTTTLSGAITSNRGSPARYRGVPGSSDRFCAAALPVGRQHRPDGTGRLGSVLRAVTAV